MMKKILLILLIINSCSYPELVRDELVYSNDFENKVSKEITGGEISFFNGSSVLGDFNNDGFTLHLENVGDHDYIFISLDLYIHGSWDGNLNGFEKNDKADKWTIELKPEMNSFKDPASDKFVTTFSNSPCFSNYCLKQSYPNNYPFDNNPTKGAFRTNLDRKCENNFFGGPTSLYKIEKTFRNSGNAIIVRFFDELYQPNAIDRNGKVQFKCDESWSVDNISVRAIKYQ